MGRLARTARFYMVSSWPIRAKIDEGEYSCVKDKGESDIMIITTIFVDSDDYELYERLHTGISKLMELIPEGTVVTSTTPEGCRIKGIESPEWSEATKGTEKS